MSIGRYSGKKVHYNDNDLYDEQFEKRGVGFIKHFETPTLSYPTDAQKRNLNTFNHVWKSGDRYWKLAAEYYGDPGYWWVLAWYNKKPTESHLSLGDVVRIPEPLERVLDYYDL
tara:strand:- start:159 stop:500 length:342 start_codon:yes stop_codon:yes gene_type:complete